MEAPPEAETTIYQALGVRGAREAYACLLSKVDVEASTGCHIVRLRPAKARGYTQVRYKGTKYYCHVIAAMVSASRAPDALDEASHYVCHTTHGVLTQHICAWRAAT